jgi:myo-inositol-1(or 4)-monophosphatase
MSVIAGDTLDAAHRTALDTITLAREVLRQRAATPPAAHAKGRAGDVVTDIDLKSENLMIKAIHEAFPHHRIRSEEGGEVEGSAEWTWLIDPVDGTNNLVLGIPLMGSCITLCHNGVPVVAAIYVVHEDVTYSAVQGGGALREGKPIRISYQGEPELATVSWINGYAVKPGDESASHALAVLDRRFKRTLSLWSPSVDWSLLLQGRTGALLSFQNEPEDLLCGVLIAAEAGAVITDFSGRRLRAISDTDRLIVAAPEVAPYVAEVLSELR